MLACQSNPQPSTYFLADRGATRAVDLNRIASFWADHQGLPFATSASCLPSGRRDQANFANHRLAAVQTLGIETGPDLLRTISSDSRKFKPVRLRQHGGLGRCHLRRKTRQGNNRRSQKAEYGQGRERVVHVRLLTVADSRSRFARGSWAQRHDPWEVPLTATLFEEARPPARLSPYSHPRARQAGS